MENESYREAVVSVVKDQLHKGSKCSGTRSFLRKKKKKEGGKGNDRMGERTCQKIKNPTVIFFLHKLLLT